MLDLDLKFKVNQSLTLAELKVNRFCLCFMGHIGGLGQFVGLNALSGLKTIFLLANMKFCGHGLKLFKFS